MTARRLLLHSAGWSPGPLADVFAAEQIEVRPLGADAAEDAMAHPTAIVLDPAAWREPETLAAIGGLASHGVATVLLGASADDDPPADAATQAVAAFVTPPFTEARLLVAIATAFRETETRHALAQAQEEARERAGELHELSEIGASLLTERDYERLLRLILALARRVTLADAGSLYLVETDADGNRSLRFTLAQNATRPDIPFVSFTMPLDDRSIAGYAALSGVPLSLDDAYETPAGAPYSFNRSFDEKYGYRTKSMLTVPMPNHRGEVIGVLQLINRKRDDDTPFRTIEEVARRVEPFNDHCVRLARSLAGQAAVSIENSQLYAEIERLFEGFVKAAVSAIEQRDPATSGHSERVTQMTVRLAEVVNGTPDGVYGATTFSPAQLRELRYAGLLHDFGKVGVREEVLVKGAKLYPGDLNLVEQRQAFLVRTSEWQFEKARADYLETYGREGYAEWLAEAEAQATRERAALQRFLELVRECNQPSVLVEPHGERYQELREFAQRRYVGIDGKEQPLLTPLEFAFLSIRRGTLNETERLEIESHVVHSVNFLKRIPWTKDLRDVPEIAHGHHEKLDGSGYPRAIRGDQIGVRTRMMTIADIFDALTASDRPYKRAMAVNRALEILAEEARLGQIDADLFRLFVEQRVYEVTRPPT